MNPKRNVLWLRTRSCTAALGTSLQRWRNRKAGGGGWSTKKSCSLWMNNHLWKYQVPSFFLVWCTPDSLLFFFTSYSCHVAYIYIWQILFLFHFLYNVAHYLSEQHYNKFIYCLPDSAHRKNSLTKVLTLEKEALERSQDNTLYDHYQQTHILLYKMALLLHL